MEEKIACKKCGQMILQVTAKKTDGLCIHCYSLSKGKPAFIKGGKIHLFCRQCKQEYVLGENAIVSTPEKALDSFGGYLWLTGSSQPSPTSLSPDMVALVSKKPNVTEQDVYIDIIKRSMSSRKWKCLKCGYVQSYM